MEADGQCLYEVSRRGAVCCGSAVVQLAAARQHVQHLQSPRHVCRSSEWPRTPRRCGARLLRVRKRLTFLSTLYEDARPLVQADIKKAYRTLALRCHPDKCPGDEVRSAVHACRAPTCRPVHMLARRLPERRFAGRAQTAKASFQSLQRIYAVLGDPEKCGPTQATQLPPAALCQVPPEPEQHSHRRLCPVQQCCPATLASTGCGQALSRQACCSAQLVTPLPQHGAAPERRRVRSSCPSEAGQRSHLPLPCAGPRCPQNLASAPTPAAPPACLRADRRQLRFQVSCRSEACVESRLLVALPACSGHRRGRPPARLPSARRLSDRGRPGRRKVYDQTGSLADSEELAGEQFDALREYFRALYKQVGQAP